MSNPRPIFLKPLRELVPPESERHAGIRVQYQRNVLYCACHRRPEDNFEAIKQALSYLTGLGPEILFGRHPDGSTLFEEDGGTVAYYTSSG